MVRRMAESRTTEQVEQAAVRLLQDRDACVALAKFPTKLTPSTLSQGYQLQDQLIKKYKSRGDGIGGWKVGLASRKMQKAVGIPHPIEGPILASLIRHGGAHLSINDYLTLCVEAEMAFVVGEDIAAGEKLYTPEQVSARIESVAVAIEIADDRGSNNSVLHGGGLNIANFVHNAGCVMGNPVQDWSTIDLAQETLQITLNGYSMGAGAGSEVLGNPINSATWLVNNLSQRGYVLLVGSIIMTGCVTTTIWLNEGDSLTVKSKHLGEVSVKIVR